LDFMVDTRIHQIDKKTWHKWSFYINLIIFIIIALAIYLLIIDSYNAGQIAQSQAYGTDQLSQAWLAIGRDIAFLAICLTYVFSILYRYQRLIIRRSW
jgi:NhaP-type Na+/H+ or K+/H+ antiporter